MQILRIKSLSGNKLCSMMLGLCNPYAMEQKTFLGYDITKLMDNQRFFEVMLSRYGTANSITALYFDGAVSYFAELPKPNDTDGLNKVYAWIQRLKRRPARANSMLVFSKIVRKLTGKTIKND